MAEVTIRLRIDPATGKKDIIISMESDDDALPHEHEQQHKAIVNKLLEGGVVKAAEVGQIVVEREEKQPIAAPTPAEPQSERQATEQRG
jgi:tryptophanase